MLFDRADAFDQVINLFGKAGNVLYGQFERVDALVNIFEFSADIGEARAHLCADIGEAGVHFLAEVSYRGPDAADFGFNAGDFSLVIGRVAGESGKSPFDQRFKPIKTFIIGLWHAHSISL